MARRKRSIAAMLVGRSGPHASPAFSSRPGPTCSKVGVRTAPPTRSTPAIALAAVDHDPADPARDARAAKTSAIAAPCDTPSSVKRSTTVSRSETHVSTDRSQSSWSESPQPRSSKRTSVWAVAQLREPMPPQRALPVDVEMCQPGRGPHDRRPAAMDGECESDAISSGAEADLLRHESASRGSREWSAEWGSPARGVRAPPSAASALRDADAADPAADAATPACP